MKHATRVRTSSFEFTEFECSSAEVVWLHFRKIAQLMASYHTLSIPPGLPSRVHFSPAGERSGSVEFRFSNGTKVRGVVHGRTSVVRLEVRWKWGDEQWVLELGTNEVKNLFDQHRNVGSSLARQARLASRSAARETTVLDSSAKETP